MGLRSDPIIEIDVHGLFAEQAVARIRTVVNNAGAGVYRIRVIHGYNSGTRIRSAIRRELGYGLEPKIRRIEMGNNEGVTELVLREY